MLYFEDFPAGKRFDFKPIEVKAEEVIAFASEFDPQPMHLSEEGGKASILGGLAASGWHTSAMMMRMLCDSYIHETASEGSPGVDSDGMEESRAGRRYAIRQLHGRRGAGVALTAGDRYRETAGVVTNQRGETVAICDYANMIRCQTTGETA